MKAFAVKVALMVFAVWGGDVLLTVLLWVLTEIFCYLREADARDSRRRSPLSDSASALARTGLSRSEPSLREQEHWRATCR